MQKLINWIFVIGAVCVIIGTIVWASESAKNGNSDYGFGWFWGIVTAFCIWALWHGFATGVFWQ